MRYKSRAIQDKVTAKPLPKDDMAKNKFVIPDMGKEKPYLAKVVSVGRGFYSMNGELLPLEVKVGDIVMFPKFGATSFEIDGEEYYTCKESEILSILDPIDENE